MKKTPLGKLPSALICFFLTLCLGIGKGQAHEDIPAGVTNCISAELDTVSHESVTIFVILRRCGDSLPFPPTNTTRRLIASYYWGATNSFCGPMELVSESGKKMRLLKPEILSPQHYPEKFDLRPLHDDFWNKAAKSFSTHDEIPGHVLPEFLTEGNRPYQYRYFNLNEFFKVKKPGDYKLTVWPVIYRRSSTNDDMYEKIDVPPVTKPIHVTDDMIR